MLPYLLMLVSTQLPAAACLIESDDEQAAIRLCQENISIPAHLFTESFCQPALPDRHFKVTRTEQCPDGAYAVCRGAHTEGVGYQQSIYYYTDADDARYLAPYCENISRGQWHRLDQ